MGIEIEVGLENAAKMPRITEETLELESPKGLANPKVRRLLIAGGAVLLGALTGLYLFYRLRESTDDAQVDAHVAPVARSEEHTSELQSQSNLVCRLLLEKKKRNTYTRPASHAS